MRFGLDIKISKIVANLQEKCEEEKFHMFWDTFKHGEEELGDLSPIEMGIRGVKLPYIHV
jgi:hypothetical protein